MFRCSLVEGSLEVKLPTIWTDGKQSWAEAERRGEYKREDQRRERVRRKKMQMREKVGQSRNTCVFPMICGSGGSKSRLAKAAGAEPASWPDETWKSARPCGAKHVSKSKCTKHAMFGPLLEVAMSKKCTPLWREAHFEVNMYKTLQYRTTFGSWDVEKAHAVVAEAYFEVKMFKTPHVRATFQGSDVASRGRRKGLYTLSKVSKKGWFCSIFNYHH